ncbi:hypothetical protein FOYG_17564 [Fusarium oxysporum NRRL 32931]|uniref:Prion-inhibition and propagation HeLo domain-containing protein n=1 Tax=Fusarium oxysporum NRRL 32931 TaxID=660029 RepID=W9H9J8_FUSOX|nr:hypothetical protein FOYG_17564 [Fusarium oxysporum NRRL 32931]
MDEAFTKISERHPSLLFNDCVDLFNCIRFNECLGLRARHVAFKLDIVKCRLARWATRVIGGQSFEACLNEVDLDTMREILQGMVVAFQACYNRSCRQSRRLANNEDTIITLDKLAQQLRDKLHTFTEERLSGANLIDKTPWTIYDEEHIEILIRDCAVYIDELEREIQFDTEDLIKEAEKQIDKFDNICFLRELKNASQDIDFAMTFVAATKYESRMKKDGGPNISRAPDWNRLPSQLASGNNSVGYIGSKFRGNIHIGNTYGGKGFWDV